MQVTTETFIGKSRTFLCHRGESFLGTRFVTLTNGVIEFFSDADCLNHTATALPPLPRNPKPEDAALLYRYMSEGLIPHGIIHNDKWERPPKVEGEFFTAIREPDDYLVREITHVKDPQGNRVEVAIV